MMLVKMFHILILLRALLADGVQTISIDSQLGTSIEDCFERISIGEKLSFDAIYRNVSELTSLECEHLCKQDRQCQIYVYGVGAKGNATCEVSNLSENEVRENRLLMRHPDYDIYIRRVQCEQAPPIPIQASLNDPPPEPAHKPIFRPEIDEPKRPAADFPDLRPFETKPDFYSPYKPNNNHLDDRPDSCHDSKPIFDSPPSYGDHRPQDIPYRPNTKPKPDPYDDVLQFEDQYGRPPYHLGTNYPPPFYGNDIYGHKPVRPYRPPSYLADEKPQFVYVQRPYKKPKPQGLDYNKPIGNYPSYTDYEQNQGYGPIGPPPRPFKPFRPYDDPSRPYDYHGNYASGYGGQYQESYWEHYPNRPYRPSGPIYDRPSDGYGGHQYGYGSSYGNNDFQTQNQYGSSENPLNDNKYNTTQSNRPQRPNYDSHNSYGGSGQSNNQFGHYESHYDKPTEKPVSNTQQGSYGIFQGYGSSQSSNTNNQYNLHSKPPSYDSTVSHQDDYRPQFDNTSPHYGSPSTSNNPSYGSNIPYGNKPHDFNDDRPHRPSYGIKPSQNRPSYDDVQSSYGSNINKIPITNHKPEVKPTTVKPLDYDRPDPQYGPPPYGSQDDGTDDEGYRNSKRPAKPSETNHRHTDIKPVYEYELDMPSGAPAFTRPGGQVVTSKPVAVGNYGRPDRRPGFVVSYKEPPEFDITPLAAKRNEVPITYSYENIMLNEKELRRIILSVLIKF